MAVETLKYGGTQLLDLLLSVCNKVLLNDDIAPQQWRQNIIIPIPKKTSKSMKDFRGISLMSVAAKLYNRMILNRIYTPIDNILRPNQAGFRRGRNCAEQIHILRRLIEGYHQRQLPLAITFVDFSKAFDSINRNRMWKILRHYGIPQVIVRAIAKIYHNSESCVLLDGEYSRFFGVNTGVLQGDTLAPFLFIIVLDYILKQVPTALSINTHHDRRLADLDFADDVALLDDSREDATDHIEQFAALSRSAGLNINYNKTKVLYVNLSKENITCDDNAIEAVDDFKYLGAYIMTTQRDLLYRRALAWISFWRLDKVWKSNSITLPLKRKLFDSLILSIFLYGSETWTLTRRMEDSINSFATSCYRIILNIRRIDRVTNQAVLQQMNRSPLIRTVRSRQLRTLGHWIRAIHLPISHYALYTPEGGRNRRGRPRLNFRRYITSVTGKPIEELLEIAANREDWRGRVVDAHDPHAID